MLFLPVIEQAHVDGELQPLGILGVLNAGRHFCGQYILIRGFDSSVQVTGLSKNLELRAQFFRSFTEYWFKEVDE